MKKRGTTRKPSASKYETNPPQHSNNTPETKPNNKYNKKHISDNNSRTSVDGALRKPDDSYFENSKNMNDTSYDNINMLSANDLNNFYGEYGRLDDSIRKDSDNKIFNYGNRKKTFDYEIPDNLKNIMEQHEKEDNSNHSSLNTSGQNFLEEGKKMFKESQFSPSNTNKYIISRKNKFISNSENDNKIFNSKNQPTKYKLDKEKEMVSSKSKISNFQHDDNSSKFKSSKISLKSLTDSNFNKDSDSLTNNNSKSYSTVKQQRRSLRNEILVGSKQSFTNNLHTSTINTQKNSPQSESFINTDKISLKSTDNDFYRQESFVNLNNNDSEFFMTQNETINKSENDSDNIKMGNDKKADTSNSSFINKSKSKSKGENFFSGDNSLVQLPDSSEEINQFYSRQQSYENSCSNLISPRDKKKDTNISIEYNDRKNSDEVCLEEINEFDDEEFCQLEKPSFPGYANEIEDYNVWREQMRNIAEDDDHFARILIDNKLRIIDPYFNENMNYMISEENSFEEEESVLTLDNEPNQEHLLGQVNTSMVRTDSIWMKKKPSICKINNSINDPNLKLNNKSGILRKSSAQNFKLYTSQGDIFEEHEQPKIFRTCSLQKSKFPHKKMVSVITDGKSKDKAIIFSLSQKNFRNYRTDSIDEKLINSFLRNKKKDPRPSENTRRIKKTINQKHSKSLNNSEIENKINVSNEKPFSLKTNSFFFQNHENNNKLNRNSEIKKDNLHNLFESNNFSENNDFENSYIKIDETHDDNFFLKDNNEESDIHLNSHINLDQYSDYNNQISVQENDPFLDIVSPINPVKKFKKKTAYGSSNGNSQDYEYLFEKEENKQQNIKKSEKKIRKISDITGINTDKGDNNLFSSEHNPMNKLSTRTDEYKHSSKKENYKKKLNEIIDDDCVKNDTGPTIQNISFQNFPNIKEKSPKEDLFKIENKKLNIVLKSIDEQSILKNNLIGPINSNKVKDKKEEEFEINTSIVDIQSTTNIDTAFDFKNTKDLNNPASYNSSCSDKETSNNDGQIKKSLFNKHSTANMFQHYYDNKKEKNIFKNSMDELDESENNNEEIRILSPKSSKWNLSHVNLQNESCLDLNMSENENNNNEENLDDEYTKLLEQRNDMIVDAPNSNNQINFNKKENKGKTQFKNSNLAKKIARQSKKQNPKKLKKDISMPKSVHTTKTNNSKSNLNDSSDKNKLSLKSKLKASMAGSTKKSLYSKNVEQENLYKKSSHGSYSKLDKTIGSGSIKTKKSFKSYLGFNMLNNSITDGSNSQTKLLKNFKNKGNGKISDNKLLDKKINDRLPTKMSQPDLLKNNKTLILRRSNTQKKNQIVEKKLINNQEIEQKSNHKQKKYSKLTLKLNNKYNNKAKKNESPPNSKTSSHHKIYSVDKILNNYPSSQNFENIYNKEIIEQRSKESIKSKSEKNFDEIEKDKDKDKKVSKYDFDVNKSNQSSFHAENSVIMLNVKSPLTNNKTENNNDALSSNPESIKSSNLKWNKQLTHNSTFLPFPRSISIKQKDESCHKSNTHRNQYSKELTSESNLDGKNTDRITFTENEEISNETSAIRNNAKNLINKEVPDEYGIISDNEDYNNTVTDFKESKDSSNPSNQSNIISNSNKSEPVFSFKVNYNKKNLNKSSTSKHNKRVFQKMLKVNKKNYNKSSLKEKTKNYSGNFHHINEGDSFNKILDINEKISKTNSQSNFTQNKIPNKKSSNRLIIPKKPKISKSGKNISHKKSFHKISKKSSSHLKNIQNISKNIFTNLNQNFNKTISNVNDINIRNKKIRFSLNQSAKVQQQERNKTKDKNFAKKEYKQEIDLSFSKPTTNYKDSSLNQSSLLGKTFESDVLTKPNKEKKKNTNKHNYTSKLKSIKQEKFKESSNFQKMIELKKNIGKRTKNFLAHDKKLSLKKIHESQKKINSQSNNDFLKDSKNQKSKNSNFISEDNNPPSFCNFYEHNSKISPSNNSHNNYINIEKVNINNLVKNQETHNYIFLNSQNYIYPQNPSDFSNAYKNQTPSFYSIKPLFKDKDNGDNLMYYNSFEHNDLNKNFKKEKNSGENQLDLNLKFLLSNDVSKTDNKGFLNSEDIIEMKEPTKYKKEIKQSDGVYNNLSRSLNLRNYFEVKSSFKASTKNESNRNSVINSIKTMDGKEFDLKEKIKQIKSQRKINFDKNKSSKELKIEYNKIKNKQLKILQPKVLRSNKKSLFFNHNKNSEKSESLYQRLSSNQENKRKINSNVILQNEMFKCITQSNDMFKESLPDEYQEIIKNSSVPKRANTRTSLRATSINNKHVKRNTSLEAVLKEHSIKYFSKEQKLINGMNSNIKGLYNLEKHLYDKTNNFLKSKNNFVSLNDTTSIASMSNLEKKICNKLKPLKKYKIINNNIKHIKNNSVEQKSNSHSQFNFDHFCKYENTHSVTNSNFNSSKNIKNNTFSFKKNKISKLKSSLLKKKIANSKFEKKQNQNKYYCSSNIDNPDFNGSHPETISKEKIFKSHVFETNKIKPKLSKINLKKNNSKAKNIFSKSNMNSIKSITKESPNSVNKLFKHSFKNHQILQSVTSKPTPLRYTLNNQSYSLRGSNQKQREGFFSISSHEKQVNFTEIPSSSDNLTNSSMNSHKKSKISDINIYNQKDSLINTSGSNCEIIYKKKKKKLIEVGNKIKLNSESSLKDKRIKLNKVIRNE